MELGDTFRGDFDPREFLDQWGIRTLFLEESQNLIREWATLGGECKEFFLDIQIMFGLERFSGYNWNFSQRCDLGGHALIDLDGSIGDFYLRVGGQNELARAAIYLFQSGEHLLLA